MSTCSMFNIYSLIQHFYPKLNYKIGKAVKLQNKENLRTTINSSDTGQVFKLKPGDVFIYSDLGISKL